MKFHTLNTKISYIMHSTDPPLDYISLGIKYLSWSWYQFYQVILPVLLLQWFEGTDIGDHTQEPLPYQFQFYRVPESFSHLPWFQATSKVEFHLTQVFSQHYQWRHVNIFCLLLNRLWNHPQVSPFWLWRLNTELVVLCYHVSTYKHLSAP